MNWSANDIKIRQTVFQAWLTEKGAEVLLPASEWELVRFRTQKGTSIIYTDKRGRTSFVNEAEAAWTAYKYSQIWQALPKTKKQVSNILIRSIRARDGNLCFYCQLFVNRHDESREHLVPRASGGPDHISNLFLAHSKCNSEAGNISAPEKVKLHVKAVEMRKQYEHSK